MKDNQGQLSRRFRAYRPARWAWRVLRLLVGMALLANLLANEKPLYAEIEGRHYFPAFRDYAVALGLGTFPGELARVDWRRLPPESTWRTPVPYGPTQLDLANADYVGPFDAQAVAGWRYRHWLGTDILGRDVLAGLIHGTRTALLVSVGALFLAALIGGLMGILAGYFGNHSVGVRWWLLPLGLLALFLVGFYAYYWPGASGWRFAFVLAALLGLFFLAKQLNRGGGGRRIFLPLDHLVMRLVELLTSIPTLLILLTLIATLERTSTVSLMLIIGLLSWTSLARYLRAELLRIRELPYIEAARALGYSHGRILWRHALPNALTPLVITLAFGVAAAVLIESTLAFLGLGAVEGITWGAQLSAARDYFAAWWLAVFPGGMVFVTVVTFNLIGEGLTRALDASFG